ncbi:uncharacterized protein LOC143460212 isoform X1 [Clavelina lepadiformis]|uniref:uncharacterized protein LOC143460212 isoform X1 n=1 Tax=Clavelina lepadiformis TaxID=159417 RepID=UPI0040416962
MANTESIDDLLASLMSMGFNHEDCQEAIRMGKLSTDEAVDWILSGKPMQSSGHLVLHSQSLRGDTTDSASGSKKEESFDAAEAPPAGGANTSLTKRAVEKDTSPRMVLSRFAATREERGKILDKKRQKLEEEVKADKRNRLKVRESVLKEIKGDRKAQQELKSSKQATESPPITPSTSATSTKSTAVKKQVSCVLQIRLPDSSSVQQRFLPGQTIPDVINFLKDKLPTDDGHQIKLLQPFPRKELPSTGSETLHNLGLCPSSSLIARVTEIGGDERLLQGQNTAQQENVPHHVGFNPVESVGQAMQEAPPHQRYSFTPPTVPLPHAEHRWPASHGHRLGYEAEHEPEEIMERNVEEEDVRREEPVIAPPSRPQQPRDQSHSRHHNWGAGRQLQEESNSQQQSPDHHEGDENHQDEHEEAELESQRRRNLVMRALEGRLQHHEDPLPEEIHIPLQNIEKLTQMSFRAVIHRIGAQGRDNLTSVRNLPMTLVNKMVNELIENKRLNSNTIQLFRSRPLVRLKLDYYIYATNQLINACKIFPGLRILSLRSCSLLTDKGMETLSVLTQLVYLDLANCHQITDNIFLYFKDLHHLKHLTLDGTHVTNNGMCSYLSTPRSSLTHLSLKNLPGVSDKSMNFDLSSIQSLCIDGTNVRRLLDIVTRASNLKHLSIAGCRLYPDQLQHLATLSASLTSLNVVGLCLSSELESSGVIEFGDSFMKHLKGMKLLKQLNFRFRTSLTQHGIKNLLETSLVNMNLAHHRSIDDRALCFIAKFPCLRSLDLTNCSITDTGILHLSSLLPQLNELILTNTPLTSRGIIAMFSASEIEWSSLHALSLRQTHVDNLLLRSEVLREKCTSLLTLDLRNTKVSDSGLRELALFHLTTLLLNGSHARLLVHPRDYPGCPDLQSVHATPSGQAPPRRVLESEDEDDMA